MCILCINFLLLFLQSIVQIFIVSQICISMESLSSFSLAAQHRNLFWCREYREGKSVCARACVCVETDLECKRTFDLCFRSHLWPLTSPRSSHSIHSHLLWSINMRTPATYTFISLFFYCGVILHPVWPSFSFFSPHAWLWKCRTVVIKTLGGQRRMRREGWPCAGVVKWRGAFSDPNSVS